MSSSPGFIYVNPNLYYRGVEQQIRRPVNLPLAPLSHHGIMSASHPSHQQARKTGSRPVSHPVGRSVSCGNSIVWDYLEHVMYVFTPRSPRLPLLCVIVSPPECLSIGVWLTLFTFSSESVRLCALNVWTLRAENYSASALVHPCVWVIDLLIHSLNCQNVLQPRNVWKQQSGRVL